MNLVLLFYLLTFVACGLVSSACPPDTIICPGTEETCGERCNFILECPGGEDEKECGFDGCHHECDGNCVKDAQICDGVPDCSDESDESHCLTCNGTEDYKCLNEQCINVILRCNGQLDCGDGSDEKGCENKTTASPIPESCLANQFRCGNGQCIKNESRCDGLKDCVDNSDEEGCDVTSKNALWLQIGTGLLVLILIVLVLVLYLFRDRKKTSFFRVKKQVKHVTRL